jgi:hypothetical protein
MKTLSNAEMSFSQMLLSWMTHQTSRAMAAIKPTHRASDVAAAIAANGNPTGV